MPVRSAEREQTYYSNTTGSPSAKSALTKPIEAKAPNAAGTLGANSLGSLRGPERVRTII